MFNSLLSSVLQSTLETIYMVAISGMLSILGGLPLGVLLLITASGRELSNPHLHHALSLMVDIGRAIPFIILLVILIPVTRFLIGTAIGTNAAIVPLCIGAIPFVARIVENALKAVDAGLIEAGHAMGTTTFQLIYKILIPEARAAIIRGITITLIGLVGYSAMAGAVGGGGLGSLAINEGYQRFNFPVLLATVMVLILFVYIIQWVGDWLAKKWEH